MSSVAQSPHHQLPLSNSPASFLLGIKSSAINNVSFCLHNEWEPSWKGSLQPKAALWVTSYHRGHAEIYNIITSAVSLCIYLCHRVLHFLHNDKHQSDSMPAHVNESLFSAEEHTGAGRKLSAFSRKTSEQTENTGAHWKGGTPSVWHFPELPDAQVTHSFRVCLRGRFQKRSAFALVNRRPKIAFTNAGGHHLRHWGPE